MDEAPAGPVVTFGDWRFDPHLGELFRRSGPAGWLALPIGSRAAAILAVLLRNPGALVSKDALLDAVWPNVTVEANNLTVQIAALRRVLDDGRAEDSLIQTVPGRGYRFVGVISREAELPPPTIAETVPPSRPGRRLPVRWVWTAAAGGLAAIIVLLAFTLGHRPTPPPRMSIVVTPFENLGGNADEDYLADAITDDLTAEMSLDWGGPVVSVEASRTLKGQDITPGKIGQDFGVRYLVRGSVRKLDTTLRVNAQLLATETGAALWTDRFDVPAADLGAGQEAATERIAGAVHEQIIVTEAERGRRERPDDPDAIDLYLRGGALELQPPSAQRLAETRVFYERALQRDPSLEAARVRLASSLLDDEDANPHGRKAVLERTRALLAGIRASQPVSARAMQAQLHWLSWQLNRCPETIDLAHRLLAVNPRISPVYRWLGDCETRIGHADAAIPVLDRALALDADHPWQSHNERNMQYALLLLGRDAESIVWGKRALADNPEDGPWERGRIERRLAAAYALVGQLDDARRELGDATRLWPHFTLRETATGSEASPIYAAQLERVAAGLKLAGLRDHADEDADFGTPSDDRIRQRLVGATPLTVPGAATIRTDELVALLAAQKPIVIDPLVHFAGRSLVGAVGLPFVGEGGTLSDVAQDHLRATMNELTQGRLGAPVVAVGWNSESFDGRNLALRLAALGYTHVYWYRGGREAWEVRGLPETGLNQRDW